MDRLELFIALFFLFFLEKWISISLFFTIFHEISCQPNSFFSLILWTGKRDFLSVSVIIFLMLVSNFWETTFVCFSNLRFSIDPFSSISTAHAAVARLRRAQRAQGCSGNVARAPTFSLESFIHRPKRRKQEKGLESLACPLRSQNAIPAPYVKLPQQGPDNCDTIGSPSGPC